MKQPLRITILDQTLHEQHLEFLDRVPVTGRREVKAFAQIIAAFEGAQTVAPQKPPLQKPVGAVAPASPQTQPETPPPQET